METIGKPQTLRSMRLLGFTINLSSFALRCCWIQGRAYGLGLRT